MTGGWGAREFQLVLLRRMADQRPELVEDALRALDASRTEAREVNRRWQAMLRSRSAPQGTRRYEAVLGPAESVADQLVGDLRCRRHHWRLPFWPDLRWEVVTGPGGAVWQEWLVRAPGTPAPDLRHAGDLVPWTVVVDDVARAFAPAAPMEGTAPSRWRLAFTAPGAAGRHVADFTWGLLQVVTPPPGAAGPAAPPD
ncbi:hypothetical protein [Marinitenerispora sediminis]|uniref:Uncharacterized protein n=1 Tax=Marinitenerispora sediminis TaxID=1931232 RepID=A0A368T4V0_9ACTN|nr:hypothetical protein [Marinitenerispora sediminis]RCV51955.1 hypothetical protein DEF28_14190 [Marinitenerispora sediminis]RCV55397.1 hypothetical protein DEF23_14335 [Marinitenerispora sediminis]RCV58200.1 hypothetical protein DEF24_14075 [Marinitenerispora sediminis]